jgi:inactivated superfamily I helicase
MEDSPDKYLMTAIAMDSKIDARYSRLEEHLLKAEAIDSSIISLVNTRKTLFDLKRTEKSALYSFFGINKSKETAGMNKETIEVLEEAMLLWPKLNAFVKNNGKEPSLKSNDPLEVRMAEAIIFLKEQKRKSQNG